MCIIPANHVYMILNQHDETVFAFGKKISLANDLFEQNSNNANYDRILIKSKMEHLKRKAVWIVANIRLKNRAH